MGFPGASVVKNPPAIAGDTGLISESGRFPGEGKSNVCVCVCVMVFAIYQHVSAMGICMSHHPEPPRPTILPTLFLWVVPEHFRCPTPVFLLR